MPRPHPSRKLSRSWKSVFNRLFEWTPPGLQDDPSHGVKDRLRACIRRRSTGPEVRVRVLMEIRSPAPHQKCGLGQPSLLSGSSDDGPTCLPSLRHLSNRRWVFHREACGLRSSARRRVIIVVSDHRTRLPVGGFCTVPACPPTSRDNVIFERRLLNAGSYGGTWSLYSLMRETRRR